MKDTYQTGINGEAEAEAYLESLGMICLERRYREKCGEVDLIMMDRNTVVFVEVKARMNAGPAGSGLMSVNGAKQRRIARSATLYLMKKGWMNRCVRFDVVEINRNGVLYVPNAFHPGGRI